MLLFSAEPKKQKWMTGFDSDHQNKVLLHDYQMPLIWCQLVSCMWTLALRHARTLPCARLCWVLYRTARQSALQLILQTQLTHSESSSNCWTNFNSREFKNNSYFSLIALPLLWYNNFKQLPCRVRGKNKKSRFDGAVNTNSLTQFSWCAFLTTDFLNSHSQWQDLHLPFKGKKCFHRKN